LIASFTSNPFKNPELISLPLATSVKASFSISQTVFSFADSITWIIGKSNFLANSQSLVSWAGTAIIAPVP